MIGVSLEQAIGLLLEHTKVIEEQEVIKLCQGNNRILAEDIVAPFSQPPFDRSPLDGYSFAATSSQGATAECPIRLKVVGEVCAGSVFKGTVKEGEAVRIMTGAPIPEGCDCVLRQEDTDYGEQEVAIFKSLMPYSNYCYKGEDIKEGSLILKKGEKLSPITLGVLASMGIEEIRVIRKLKVALICTGDELIPVGTPLLPGKIYNSNGIMLEERMKALGMAVIRMEQCEDTPEKVAQAIEEVSADLIVTTGGVSVGKKDIMHDVLKLLQAKRLFWRVAMQPGTPILAGYHKKQLIIGLSGNPFAALANFELIVREVMAKMQQDNSLKPMRIKAKMAEAFHKSSQKRRFIRAKYTFGSITMGHQNHSSGSLYTMSLCNCLVEIPAGTASLEIGDEVTAILL